MARRARMEMEENAPLCGSPLVFLRPQDDTGPRRISSDSRDRVGPGESPSVSLRFDDTRSPSGNPLRESMRRPARGDVAFRHCGGGLPECVGIDRERDFPGVSAAGLGRPELKRKSGGLRLRFFRFTAGHGLRLPCRSTACTSSRTRKGKGRCGPSGRCRSSAGGASAGSA
jgi:hypothetical protein